MPLRFRFEDHTSAELAALDPAERDRAVCLVPLAATEQHGAHLPLGTDALIADAMVDAVGEHLGDARFVTVLATQRVGASAEHEDRPGTLSLGWRGAVDTILSLGHGLRRAGFRRLALVSSHGGNMPAIDIAALELRRAGLLCAVASWNRFGLPEGLLPSDEIAHGIHGGAVETSLMLQIRPDLVRGNEIADQRSLQGELAATNRHLRAHGRLGFGWMASDLNAAGTVGDARLATKAIGAAILQHQARGCAEFLREVSRFDLARLSVQSADDGPISRT